MRKVLGVRSACALFVLVIAAAAAAQDLPRGSYLHTCRDAHVVDGTLEANCQQANGDWRQSALPNAWDCKTEIENRDGRLICKPPHTTEFEEGYGTFGLACEGKGQGAEYVIIRLRGRRDDEVRIAFDSRYTSRIHMFLPRGTTFAASCGSFPSEDAVFKFAALD